MASAWKHLSEWLQQGRLEPVIDKVFPLDEAVNAYRRLQEGKNFGKLVLKIM
jgi:zinc-binding alcohol dehydrogenase/oxidoreductase